MELTHEPGNDRDQVAFARVLPGHRRGRVRLTILLDHGKTIKLCATQTLT
jgi:hypothetical protein